MGLFDSKYNANYGIREERNSSGNIYYDRKGNSHYERSDAMRANERIRISEKKTESRQSQTTSLAFEKATQKAKPRVKRTQEPVVRPKLSAEQKALLEQHKEIYERLNMFVNENDFSYDDFLGAADFMNISIPETIRAELEKYGKFDYKTIDSWENNLTNEASEFINEVFSSGVAISDESYGIINELEQ